MLDSRVGALDRTLGFLFGAARGLLVVVVAFCSSTGCDRRASAAGMGPTPSRDPMLKELGTIECLLPEDPEARS